MNNQIEMPHNQLIYNTGGHYTGIIFEPFGTELPSDYSVVRRSPIGGGSGTGWIARPDVGGTTLSKEAEAPIGEPYVLVFFAFIYALWIRLRKHVSLHVVLLMMLFPLEIQAQVTALDISTAVSGAEVTIVPTIGLVPAGKVYVCWGVYYDAACEQEVEDVKFYEANAVSANAVRFRAPTTAGTYYIKTSLHTGSFCGGLMDSYYISPIAVYPANANIVLQRDEQGPAARIDITDAVSKQAYGALRFSKSRLNDASVSIYERYNYFVSFPFDVKVGDIYGIGTVGTDWRILYYDGMGRAEEGFFAERTDNWVMFSDTEDVLHAGEGYLLQLNTYSMAESNTAVWVNGADMATLFFPASSTISALETTDATMPALGSEYVCTIDLSATYGAEGDRTTKDSYWRCIGVPSFSSPSGVTGLPYLYEWSTADNSLNVVSSDTVVFKLTHAYLAQNGDAFTWTDVTRPASVAARRTETENEWLVELWQDGQVRDRTYVRKSGETRVTEGFDFGRDLIKERNAGKANVYTMIGYERVAANMVPDTVRSVPVGLEIVQEGSYRLTVNEGAWIVDGETGVRTQSYAVNLTAGVHEGRFRLEIGDAVSTGWMAGNVTSGKAQKEIMDGRIYIIREGKIYDTMGKIFQNDQK